MIAAAPTRAFDVAVVVHAVVALVAVVVLVVLRAAAGAVRAAGEPPPTARRSFSGRRELAGRSVHLVVLTGLWALAASRGADALSSGFVVAGAAMWLVAAVALEAVAFPAQRATSARLADLDWAAAAASARRMAGAVTVALCAVVAAAAVMIGSQGL